MFPSCTSWQMWGCGARYGREAQHNSRDSSIDETLLYSLSNTSYRHLQRCFWVRYNSPLSSSPSREGCLQINNGQRHLIYLMLQTSFAKESNTKFPDLVPWDTKLGHFFSQIQVYPIKTYPSLMNKLYHTCLMIVLTCDVIVFVGRENALKRCLNNKNCLNKTQVYQQKMDVTIILCWCSF